MRPLTSLAAIALLLGCHASTPAAPPPLSSPPPPEPRAAPIAVDARAQWGEVGCTPNGPEIEVQGRWVVDPPRPATGKILRGEWIVGDDGTRFLVSYAGGRFHPELEGKRVAVRGRRCLKEGQSVRAEHLALSEIRLVP